MSELKKCPFCPDGIGILKDRYIQGIANRKTYWVECNKCQARIQNRRSAKRAVEAWNADYRCVQPENEPLTLEELIQRCTPKAAELLKRGLFGAVKVCAVDETIQKTNADRIRCMSDEELAKIIVSESVSEKIPFCQNKPECSKMLDDDELIPESHCIKCALDWLQKPAETEGKK
jgi:hypothetical protein